MQKRLFVAVSLPEDVKKRLFRFVRREYGTLPVRWVREENFHLTLEFLGYVPDENISDICEIIRKVAQNFSPFELVFKKIEAGPSRERKKMIWAIGEKSEELSNLKHQLSKALGFRGREKREFKPHITLGRIRKEKWKKISPEPDIAGHFGFSFPISSIELFESKFEKGRRVYYLLESFALEADSC